MRFVVDPVPEMVSQRLLPSFLHVRPLTAIIDPTCGRYCLKALLKHWIEKKRGPRLRDEGLVLSRPDKPNSSWFSPSDWVTPNKWDPHWIAYDPYDDFQAAEIYLSKLDKPDDLEGWEGVLREHGPVILSGVLGAASVGHYILLIGVDTDARTFIFKDPLTGDVEKQESFDTMQERIDDEIVVGNAEAMNALPNVINDMIRL